jgi:ribosomal protein S27AE
MSASQSPSNFTSILRPHCPNCRFEMALSRVFPWRATLDLRTFECGKCGHVEKAVAEIDPMKSNALGWLLGELRPPN